MLGVRAAVGGAEDGRKGRTGRQKQRRSKLEAKGNSKDENTMHQLDGRTGDGVGGIDLGMGTGRVRFCHSDQPRLHYSMETGG